MLQILENRLECYIAPLFKDYWVLKGVQTL